MVLLSDRGRFQEWSRDLILCFDKETCFLTIWIFQPPVRVVHLHSMELLATASVSPNVWILKLRHGAGQSVVECTGNGVECSVCSEFYGSLSMRIKTFIAVLFFCNGRPWALTRPNHVHRFVKSFPSQLVNSSLSVSLVLHS